MKFKFKSIKSDDDVVYSSDHYYDLMDGGYIDPHEMLEDSDQADKVVEAAELIRRFLDEALAAGNLGEM